MTGRCLALAVLACLLPAFAAAADPPASARFGAIATPSHGPAAAIGSYARGCLAGAAELARDDPNFQAMRISRNRRYGHPELVAFVRELAAAAPGLGLEGLMVGDLSQARGGPMPYGHTSHQIGLDVDIWFAEMPVPRLSYAAREDWPFVSMLAADGKDVDPARFREPFAALLRRAAEDPRVARIFVNPAIKRAMCDWTGAGEGEARAYLAKIRPWYGHDAHFHVRLACPEPAGACVDQAPPPPGDGCGAPLAYWFTDEPYKPRPGIAPKDPLTLATLPAACRALATPVPPPRP